MGRQSRPSFDDWKEQKRQQQQSTQQSTQEPLSQQPSNQAANQAANQTANQAADQGVPVLPIRAALSKFRATKAKEFGKSAFRSQTPGLIMSLVMAKR